MSDIINMTITTSPAVNQSITGFGIKGDPGTTSWAGITDKPNSFMPSVHTHTAANVTDFDTEVSNNTDVAANTTARHTHANKTLLDTYSQTEVNLADAVAKKHTHANSAVLNDTTASFTTADETKLDGIATGAQVNTVTSVNTRTGAVTGLAEASDLTAHTGNTSNPHSVTKAQVGLGNVSNLAPADMPVSTAQAAADALKVNKAGDTMTGQLKVDLSADPSNGGIRVEQFGNGAGHGIRVANAALTSGANMYWNDNTNFYIRSDAALNIGGASNRTTINGIDHVTGTGFPNGVVSAPVGSIYIDTAVTNGASSWIKKSGTGNTGWQVLEGDTGWRNITSLFSTQIEVVNPNDYGFLIRRVGNTVQYNIKAQTVATSWAGQTQALPSGFAPSVGGTLAMINEALQTGGTGRGQIQLSTIMIFVSATWSTAGVRFAFSTSNLTNAPWPTTLPGTAA